jgi:hypothetical protein
LQEFQVFGDRRFGEPDQPGDLAGGARLLDEQLEDLRGRALRGANLLVPFHEVCAADQPQGADVTERHRPGSPVPTVTPLARRSRRLPGRGRNLLRTSHIVV